jgi:hypothetical protein
MTDHFDDDPDAEFPTAGVPPAPSVTPGPNPPPPNSATDDATDQRGCVTILIVGTVLAIVALVVAIALVVIGIRVFGISDEDANAKVLQEVFVETGIATASRDAVHPPQRDIHLGTCESDGSGGVKASGTLTNWTTKTADYEIDVSFRRSGIGSSGEEFAASAVSVLAVPEHATTTWTAIVPDRPDGAYACRVLAVNRWPTGTTPPS